VRLAVALDLAVCGQGKFGHRLIVLWVLIPICNASG
jgi:hypothetical protein